ncbi:MAG: hypothetical protein J6K88_04765 [Oscillospiraceae bacterium]|nr:hypothetical protein [Oscillospiraceae bacterium]
MNKKLSFALVAFAAFILSFSVVFAGFFATVAIVDKEAWNLIKNEYLNKSDTLDKVANQNIGDIITGKVQITINKEFIGLMSTEEKPFDYTLTQEQKEKGFIDIKKNDDGSATYVIEKKDYENFISEFKAITRQTLDELVSKNTYSSIKSITYNDDFSKIVITADEKSFENSLDSFAILSCGLSSCMYQMFDVDASGKCIISVKDSTSGEIFKTAEYPADLNNNN